MRRGWVAVSVAAWLGCAPTAGLDGRPSNPGCLGRPDLPDDLDETGCFEPGTSTPVAALVPYGVQVSLWSDGAAKERFVALPDGAALEVQGDGHIELPPGGVLVKTFRAGAQLVETRLLVRAPDGSWRAATYLWNEAGTRARRFEGGLVERAGRTWEIPSAAECFDCHIEPAGVSLGLELAQLDAPLTYPATGRTENQIDTLQAIGMLDSVDAEQRTGAYEGDDARAYLAVNCAHCHRPGGNGAGTMDLRYSTPERLMHVVAEPPERGDPTGTGGRLVEPGAPDRSVLLLRMRSADPTWRMPPLGTREPDEAGVALVEEWIEAMPRQ